MQDFRSKGGRFEYPKNVNEDKRAILGMEIEDMYDDENYVAQVG
jgi:hypothetical protein